MTATFRQSQPLAFCSPKIRDVGMFEGPAVGLQTSCPNLVREDWQLPPLPILTAKI